MKDGIFNCFSIYYNKNYGLIIQFNVKLTMLMLESNLLGSLSANVGDYD